MRIKHKIYALLSASLRKSLKRSEMHHIAESATSTYTVLDKTAPRRRKACNQIKVKQTYKTPVQTAVISKVNAILLNIITIIPFCCPFYKKETSSNVKSLFPR
jgi:hypothetical protein